MSKLNKYVKAAILDNACKACKGGVRHVEVERGGSLPTSAESVARYLVDRDETLSVDTLRQQLVGLVQLHLDQGFPDRTEAPIVKKAFNLSAESSQEKWAKPLHVDLLSQVNHWLEAAILAAGAKN